LKQITLTQGKIALVDDDIYEAIGHLKWYARKDKNRYYAVRNFQKSKGQRGAIYLHHIVIGYPLDNQEVDHIDGDGLNNQRNNLRIVTNRKNQQNTNNHRNGRLVGCYFHKRVNRWQARIVINGRQQSLGYFDTEIEASKVYENACNELVNNTNLKEN
jgi:hypothetical protein